MTYSSYQMERLIDRLRQLSDWLPWPAYQRWRGAERVHIRQAAARAAHAARAASPRAPASPLPSVAAVRADRRYAPRVEEEQERRAGTFMDPPYLDTAPFPPIPRSTAPSRRRRPRPMAEGD